MATLYSPKIVTDGLVLALDAANTNSFRGEPTTNIAYNSNGTIDWGITNLTASVSRTTVVTDSIYRITSTTGGTFRILFNLSKLVNGTTYTLSYNYKIISGGPTFTMNDWNDTNIFNVINTNIGDYTFSAASGTRATYDSTFRFMDFNISASTVVEIWNLQLEAKTYPTPFIAGIRGTTVATGGGWVDRSGNSNHGELVNGPTYNSSNLGSISFDGVDDYITVPHNSNLNLINTVSLEAWVKYTTTTNTVLIEKSNNNTHYQLQIFNNTQGSPAIAGQLVFMLQPNSSNWVVSGIVTNDTNWHHVVGTYDRDTTTARIYVDGILRNTNSSISTGPTSNTQPLLIGSRSGPSGFGGSVSGVKIYNRVLSASEVLQNYNATKGRYGL
jgi:hypothetical protein